MDNAKIYITSRRNNELVIEWVKDIELFSNTKQRTNYIEAQETVLQKNGTKKVQCLGQWITDLDITTKNAKIIF